MYADPIATRLSLYTYFADHWYYLCFFFNDTATTEIYTLSLHDALPIWAAPAVPKPLSLVPSAFRRTMAKSASVRPGATWEDRKSTRLNSSHGYISYAVFCLKKKKKKNITNSSNTSEHIHHDSLKCDPLI